MKKKSFGLILSVMSVLLLVGCNMGGQKNNEDIEVSGNKIAEMEEIMLAEITNWNIQAQASLLSDDVLKRMEDNIPITIERGRYENGYFINETLKIAFPIDRNNLLSDEEVLRVYGVDLSILDENGRYSVEDFRKEFNGLLCDAYIYSQNPRMGMLIIYDDVSNFYDVDEVAYMLYVGKAILGTDEFEVNSVEVVEIGGLNYYHLGVTNANADVSIYVRKQANCFITFMYTGAKGDTKTRDEFFASFIDIS